MNEAALLEFQLAEIGDAIRLILSGVAFLIGAGMWIRATYFMKEGE